MKVQAPVRNGVVPFDCWWVQIPVFEVSVAYCGYTDCMNHADDFGSIVETGNAQSKEEIFGDIFTDSSLTYISVLVRCTPDSSTVQSQES